MEKQSQKEKCLAIGLAHIFEFVVAAHGYQCFVCNVCGYAEDVVEDFPG